jgi:hypothetical protein
MKKYLILVLIALIIGALFVGVLAAPAGKSNVAHLYLYEKTDDGSNDWPIVEDGAWGKMKYNLSGDKFEFFFNGHGLEVGEDYTLIYYPDPWPVIGLICLGSGIVNESGDIHIAESVDTGDLPIDTDENDGAKIWLVLSSCVDCEGGTWVGGWNHTEYLFEGELITFDDTDD